ncbi:MAG: cell surface protein, partial [Aliifodinibius sp.]|nr:cell surface protein [Fodinibius sp.]NIV10243.1 cell surface protein [Fodinibius sp.]NIY23869.1 cell surface protein [Fodinibius sp.]
GNSPEHGYSIAVDDSGRAYVTGFTNSTDFPTLNPYQTYQDSADVFITALSDAGNDLAFSTYLGGSGHDAGAF